MPSSDRSPSPMRIRLSDERRSILVESIQRYFAPSSTSP